MHCLYTMSFLLLLLIVVTAGTSALDKDDAPSFIVGGYLPDYRSYINVNSTAIHLTDIMLFSLTPESVLKYHAAIKAGDNPSAADSGGCCLSSNHYEQIRKAKSYKREQQQLLQQRDNVDELRLLLTVGGGGRSDGFADSVVNRQNEFVKGLVQLW